MNTQKYTVYATIICLSVLTSSIAIAAGPYKWVDKDGKIHYTDVPPTQGDASRVKVPAANPSPESPSEDQTSDRDAKGNCRTMKCLADEMEATRLQREKDYDRQRAENERYAKQKSNPPHYVNGRDLETMIQQCRSGACGTDTRNCEDRTYLLACSIRQSEIRERAKDTFEQQRGWRP